VLICLQIAYNIHVAYGFKRVPFMQSALDKQSDANLLARCSAGEEAAFREIVTRYKSSLYTFLRRFLTRDDLLDDIFQETFLQLFSSKDSFDPSKPLRPWLFTIAANKAKDALRKQHRINSVPIGTMSDSEEMSFEDVLNVLSSDETMPYEELERNETANRVRQIIRGMPESLREILILAYFSKFSYKQMAEILSIPIGTVKSRLHTAVGCFAKAWKAAVGSKNNK
jgi:RNA polymerase sigma-70 factor (ECF subfamily)